MSFKDVFLGRGRVIREPIMIRPEDLVGQEIERPETIIEAPVKNYQRSPETRTEDISTVVQDIYIAPRNPPVAHHVLSENAPMPIGFEELKKFEALGYNVEDAKNPTKTVDWFLKQHCKLHGITQPRRIYDENLNPGVLIRASILELVHALEDAISNGDWNAIVLIQNKLTTYCDFDATLLNTLTSIWEKNKMSIDELLRKKEEEIAEVNSEKEDLELKLKKLEEIGSTENTKDDSTLKNYLVSLITELEGDYETGIPRGDSTKIQPKVLGYKKRFGLTTNQYQRLLGMVKTHYSDDIDEFNKRRAQTERRNRTVKGRSKKAETVGVSDKDHEDEQNDGEEDEAKGDDT